jgi:uncharacterized protein (TIGR03437 family)
MITLAGTVNSGSFIGGSVAPGELLTFFGAKLGPSAPQGLQVENGKVTTSLAAVRVLFDGVPAPIILAYSNQVNAIVPYSVAGKQTTMVQLEYLGVRSPPINMPVALAAPSIFTADGSGRGQISALNQDFSYNGGASPASGGSVIVFFMTGAGQTSPSGIDGLVPSDPNNLATAAQTISVTIGGQNATVAYAGNTIGIVSGAMQLNVLVPNGLSPGDEPIVVKVGTAQSQPGATVSVR